MSNPFDLNNLGGLMAGMQQTVMRIKAEAEAARVVGESRDGLVKVTATGGQEIVAVEISDDAFEDDNVVDLEDLIMEATNNALQGAKELMAQKMSALTGGLPMPPGLF